MHNSPYKVCIFLLLFFSGAGLFGQDCEAALEDALESFSEQKFDQIITFLTDCPPDRWLEKSQKILGYELLAQAYFEKELLDSAKVALNELLALQPDYSPQPPQYPAGFISTVQAVKDERARKEGGSLLKNKWFWIGGAAVAAAAVILIAQKPQAEESLPEAPDPPGF